MELVELVHLVELVEEGSDLEELAEHLGLHVGGEEVEQPPVAHPQPSLHLCSGLRCLLKVGVGLKSLPPTWSRACLEAGWWADLLLSIIDLG